MLSFFELITHVFFFVPIRIKLWDAISGVVSMTWTLKDSNDRKVVEGVLDLSTVKAIYHLQSRGVIGHLCGVVKEGKESTIVVADDKDGNKIIVKIFKIEASQFQKMQKYIVGDKRFVGIKLGRRSLIFEWCRKEFSNLKRARKAGVNVPEPIGFYRNVLVMEYIGNGGLSPKLKDAQLENPLKVFSEIVRELRKLYCDAGLVHADLSEFNILVREGAVVIHDMGQSVEKSHQLAQEFLVRDVGNLCRYFEKLGVSRDKEKVLDEIVEGHK